MTFTDSQTAYDRQLPDESESTPLTYDSISNDNLWYIAEKLAERVADGKNLSWGYRRSFITSNQVQTALAEDYDTMFELTRLTIESDANEAQKYLLAKWDEKAKDMIYEAIGEEMAMPVGYDWGGFFVSNIECPYCGHEQEVNHDDGCGYEEGVAHQMTCYECEKEFVFYTSMMFYYEPRKADCLNSGEHDWNPTVTIPRRYTKMKCSMCDEHRECTDDEKKNLGFWD